MRAIFFGDRGLRAGWRVLLFILGLAAVMAVEQVALRGILLGALHFRRLQDVPIAIAAPLGEGSLLFATLLVTALALRLERRPFSAIGLGDRGTGRRLLAGAACGVGIFTGFVMILVGIGALSVRAVPAGIALGVGSAVLFGAVGVTEELMFRGYALRTLARRIGFWPAALLTSAAFGAVHMGNGGEAIFGLVAAALIGLAFCVPIARTGSLAWPIGLHAGWDWAETYLWGTHDSGFPPPPGTPLIADPHGPAILSGGSVGPEGSALVPLAIIVVAAVGALVPRSPNAARGGSA